MVELTRRVSLSLDLHYVDLFSPMNKLIEYDNSEKLSSGVFTFDGTILNERGNMFVAYQILNLLLESTDNIKHFLGTKSLGEKIDFDTFVKTFIIDELREDSTSSDNSMIDSNEDNEIIADFDPFDAILLNEEFHESEKNNDIDNHVADINYSSETEL